jgi:predicted ArsR family transcriptional regulator
MNADERRSHRLNQLLQIYLRKRDERALYQRAKKLGVSDSTAKDYLRTVIIRAKTLK